MSESTLYAWLASSQRGEPGFSLDEFHGDRDVPLDQAAKQCLRLAAAKIVQQLSSRALLGDWNDSLYKGARVYELNPQYLDWSNDDFKNLGIDVGQRYLRDAQNNLIPIKVWSPPPVALCLAVAASNFPRMWGAKSETTMTMRGSVNLGVTTVPSSKTLAQVTVVKTPAIAPPPIDDGDDDLSGLLDGIPEEAAVDPVTTNDRAPAEPEPALAPMTADEQRFGSRLTSAQREILNRLRAGSKVV
jgi:hypothetical protein